uniref:CRAL-TRIO domain-containing protein n=1 Tax=Ditylenchus dipsaci TaxID=166011 RepID=A0A915CRJ5_9BILA
MFPDLTRQVYIINAPSMVSAAYKIVKTVLSEQSRDKVVFTRENPFFIREEQLTKLYIPAKSRKEINLEVSKTGDHLHWYFFTNGDIEFSVVDGQGDELWPHLRLTTDFVRNSAMSDAPPMAHTKSFSTTLSAPSQQRDQI